MESMVARISDQAESTKGGFGGIFAELIKLIETKYKGNDSEIDKRIRNISVIRHQISEKKSDMEKQMMILCEGSVAEVNELRKASVSQFLAKFENYVSRIESLNKK